MKLDEPCRGGMSARMRRALAGVRWLAPRSSGVGREEKPTLEVPGRSALAVLAALLASALIGASTGTTGAGEVGPQMPGWQLPPSSAADPIVARVGEVAIPLSLVERQLALEPPGTAPREVLERLIDMEVLAQEAARLGLGRHPGVLDAWKQAAVQRLLALDFEPITRPEDIPEDVLRESYQKNRGYFNNPDLVSIAHLLLQMKKDAGEEAWRERRSEAEQARARLLQAGPGDKEQFLAAAEAIQQEGKEIGIEDLGPVGKGSPYVQEFVDAAVRLKQDGELSEPVRTVYGWHILFRYGFKARRSVPYEQARPELVERTWADWRAFRFFEWSKQLAGRYAVEVLVPAGSSEPFYVPGEGQR